MKKITAIVEHFLKETRQLDFIQLGGEETEIEVTTKQINTFKETLSKSKRFNKNIILFAIILLGITFLIGIFFVFYHRDNPRTIGLLFGGTFLSLLVIITQLRKLWLNKSLMDLSLSVIQDLPPKEAAKFVETIYWNTLNTKAKKEANSKEKE